MQAFAESRLVPLPSDVQASIGPHNLPHYRYGDFLSGSAVRKDANSIFKQLRTTVGSIVSIHFHDLLILVAGRAKRYRP